MVIQTSPKIHCYSIPTSDEPTNALFFHRFPEQGADDSVDDHANKPCCSIHSNVEATVQCIECVKKGLPVYYCSNKCFLDAWKNHKLHHLKAEVSESCNKNSKEQDTCNSWPPFEMVSWFDERIRMVIPRGRVWINNNAGPVDALVPLADGAGFSFKLQSVIPDHSHVCAEEISVTDPTGIQRLKFSSRSLIWLSDSLNTGKYDLTEKVSKVGNIKVLTYNVLSHYYVTVSGDKYSYCPEWALTWEYRRKNLLHELIQYDADILCLQEVQNNHYESFFKPELQKFGYSVAVAFKNPINPPYTGAGGYIYDGCATFYRKDKFKKVLSYEHEYSKYATSLVGKLEQSLQCDTERRLKKDNVALVVVLEVVGNSAETPASRLCVVNTHIYANTDCPDVKLLQVSDLVNEIGKTIDPKMPLFICGDMNSIPGSDPYILLTKNGVDIACVQAPDPCCILQHLKLQHSIKLASAYVSAFFKHGDDIKGLRMKMKHSKTGEPIFTNFSLPLHPPPPRDKDSLLSRLSCRITLDYIFYKVDSLEIEGILDPPDFQNVDISIPSPYLSSDHVALMGSFRITKPFLG